MMRTSSVLKISLFFFFAISTGTAAASTTGTSTSTATASKLPPNLGDAATSFDVVDPEYVRIRLGLESADTQKKRRKGKITKTKGRKQRNRKADRSHKRRQRSPFKLQLPKFPQIQIPRIQWPNIHLPSLQIQLPQIQIPEIRLIGRGRRKDGTHLRRVAQSFEKVLKSSGKSSIDAIILLDACRNFLPVMRSFGPDAAAKDFNKNLKKAESLQRHYHGPKRKHGGKKQHPSLEELLLTEVDAGIHKPGGLLKDPSGAVGFLWMRRSIAYQHVLFEAIISGIEPLHAAHHAYRTTLMPFHTWAMKRLYLAFLGQCTPGTTKEVIAQIAGYEIDEMPADVEKATVDDLRHLVSLWGSLLPNWKRTHEILDLEDVRRH